MTGDSDFRDVVGKVKREREEKRTREVAKYAAERAQLSEKKAAGIATLKADVLPALENAKLALVAENITLEIQEDFGEPGTLGTPQFVVQFKSTTFQISHARAMSPKSDKLFISSDGKSIQWGFARHSERRDNIEVTLQVGSHHVREGLHDALKRCLESYYQDLDKDPKL